MDAIESLFRKKIDNYSAYEIFEKNFLDWGDRNNFVDIKTFYSKMGIFKILNQYSRVDDIALEDFIYYCEFMLNIINFSPVSKCKNSFYIMLNISNILKKLNFEYRQTNKKFHIVEKNVLVSEAADIVKDNYDLGEGIYSFNYRESKGNIAHKADILCRLYKYIESIENKAKSYNYSELLEDIKALANKLDIRHAATAKQSDVINNMSKDEYESLLDELFTLSLSLIILVDYKNKRKDIKALKAQLG